MYRNLLRCNSGLFGCKDKPFFALFQILEAFSSVYGRKKASRPSQAGLPHKFEKFILKKLGTISQPQRYSISSTPPNLQGYFFSNGRKKASRHFTGGLATVFYFYLL